MGGRLALVVGSECAALGELGFTEELANGLYGSLTEAGGWRPAIDLDGPVLNPTAAQLFEAVDAAFTAAAQRQATLLLGFIGHGVATSAEDFYLLGHDSPGDPNSHNAFHLTQEIRERLDRAALDGLVLLVDACEAGQGVQGAARRWTDLLAQSGGRMELLVASGDGPAYSGCFTRTMLATFDLGLPLRGENLLPSDLVDPIAVQCIHQQPQHLSFSSGAVSTTQGVDPGLWLVPNTARHRDAVSGRSAAGFVDQLTRRLLLTPDVRERLDAIVDAGSHRLRAVLGPAGVGKSTLLAMLIRPSLVDGLAVTPDYITAAVFLTVNSSVESVAAELAAQLDARLPGFREAARAARAHRPRDEFDIFDILVRRPLARLSTAGRRVTLVFDGLNQPQEGTRRLLVAAIADLTRREDLRHVRVIVGIRPGTGVEDDPGLAHMYRIDVAEPAADDIAAVVDSARGTAPLGPVDWIGWIQRLLAETPTDASGSRVVAGGWLVARMLLEVASGLTDGAVASGIGLDRVIALRVETALRGLDPETTSDTATLLGVLVAAGVGPVLPLELLDAALSSLGVDLSAARVRDIAVNLGTLVTRSHPGTVRESLGVTHGAFLPALQAECRRLGVRIADAHRALVAAIQADDSDPAADYARGAAVRHCLAYGDSALAVDFLEKLETGRSADDRDLWAAWAPDFAESLGPDHPDTFTTRERWAYHRAESGDLVGAVADFEQLLADRLRVCGPDDPATLDTRDRLASYRARCGDYAGAGEEFEQLLTDQLRLLGPDHPETLRTRNNLASNRGDVGDFAGAIARFQQLRADRARVLGADHPDTLRTRNSLAYWRAGSGDLAGARAEFEQLVADYLRVFGADHPNTLGARNNLAAFRARSGDLAGAGAEFTRLLDDRLRVLGPDHPDTLLTRGKLAAYRADSGDLAGAITDLEKLLGDRLRVLGPDHPDTFDTRNELAGCRAQHGDLTRAVAELEVLLVAELRALGPNHAATIRTQSTLAYWRNRSGTDRPDAMRCGQQR
ncbi:tetratricopeptide repeat protein [Nocardia implantans]|uniref:Tetratricopeptide repeat protein n=1 Tax=Nocardia implantans TaxID=3108168 RepID=A0ABU6ARC8_9NOCA|nr:MULTISPECIES: tetratricopeptide repeat protein [unclassified Nocardia]MBF6191472.1 tetratricopeptide repeat protein [Nocardia beijingensis]MEA3528221.1 tetratricopeptide repeat protein [Nocardia sp. CDC192]MEB3510029.1 tetratricopeptide repeat protein [Nocardia sp. CDC186]